MKSLLLGPSLVLSLSLSMFAVGGCAAGGAPDDDADEDTTETETTDDALIIGTSSGGTTTGATWCRTLKQCNDKCDADFPRGGGPLQTCKDLCKKTSSCTSSLSGIYAY